MIYLVLGGSGDGSDGGERDEWPVRAFADRNDAINFATMCNGFVEGVRRALSKLPYDARLDGPHALDPYTKRTWLTAPDYRVMAVPSELPAVGDVQEATLEWEAT